MDINFTTQTADPGNGIIQDIITAETPTASYWIHPETNHQTGETASILTIHRIDADDTIYEFGTRRDAMMYARHDAKTN